MGAQLNGVVFAQAHLQQCNFDTMDKKAYARHHKILTGQTLEEDKRKERETHLNGVDFFFSNLDFCRFRRTVAERVDFRYSHVTDCTMGKFDVTHGDFYFCGFKGCTSFIDSKFKYCSLTCATFEGECIRMVNIVEGIAQKFSSEYHDKLIHSKLNDWLRPNPCHFSSMNAEANLREGEEKISEEDKVIERFKSDVNIAGEAMNVYRNFSGIYAGKGLNRDSNEAYREAKLMERKYYKLKLAAINKGYLKLDKQKDRSKFNLRWIIIKTYLTEAAGFGYKCTAPVAWFLILVLIYALFYYLVRTLHIYVAPDWLRGLVIPIGYSFNNALSPFEEYYQVVGILFSSLQSTIGVLLVGFLGFVVANKIRSDS